MAPKKKKPSVDLITAEEWSRSFGGKMAYEVITAIVDQKDKVGPENFRMIMQTFLAGCISAFVAVIMQERPEGEANQSALLLIAENNFTDLKNRLQDAVASGFQAGVFSWSGQTVEYYAQIKPVPEPVNTKPC